MSVRLKLVVIVLFVALVPLTVSALTALRIHRGAFDRMVRELHRSAAQNGAELADQVLGDAVRSVGRAARAIPWAQASADERAGAVWLLYRTQEEVAAAAVLDERGESVGPSAFLDDPDRERELASHPAASLESLGELYRHLPDQGGEVRVGAPFSGEGEEPWIPIAVDVPGAGGARWTVAVAYSLRGLCRRLAGGREAMELSLVDGSGRALCGREALAPLPPALGGALGRAERELVEYRRAGGPEMLAAAALLEHRSPDGRWSIIAEQPAEVARAASRRMLFQTLFWIAVGVAVALGAGLFLARSVTGPVAELARGAREIRTGNLGYRVEVGGRDELAGTAEAFNRMSEEIEAWNRELQERVDERTRELEEAQSQLLRSQNIAAVSSLAAGVAHEINNPLTGVLGLAQVLKMRAEESGNDSDRRALESIERESRRIGDIVQTMLSFSEELAGSGRAQVDLPAVLEDGIDVFSKMLEQRGVEVVRAYAEDLPPVRGDAGQLRQVVIHLVSNALAAMPAGGRLEVEVAAPEPGLLRLAIGDSGRGIDPSHLERIFEPFFTTKEEWEGRGLGLTVAYRVVEEHGGRIKVESEVGRGTMVTVTLPAERGGAHLI